MNAYNATQWIDLSGHDIRSLLIALIGLDFGLEPEKRIPEIRDSRKNYANYVADQAGIKSTDTMLDLGSGCGFGTYWFAQRARFVHACDVSPAYLSFAERECSMLGNISFHLIKPLRLDCIDPESIDGVCAMSVFIHFNLYDVYWYFSEFSRIVRPGGRIWIDIADSESMDLRTPNANGSYFLKHAADYHKDATILPGLMQWNSLLSVIRIADQLGFDNLDHKPGGQLLFVKRAASR
jgi:SAM-dependent methyltransferase